MSVLDASLMIAVLDAGDAHHDAALRLVRGEIQADRRLVCSPITLAEVLVGPTRSGHLERARAALGLMGVDVAALPPDAPERLAQLRVRTLMKMPDCCVLLAALDGGCSDGASGGDCVLTFDERLAKAAAQLSVRALP
jgi:predicted nucleic acid-binding protein